MDWPFEHGNYLLPLAAAGQSLGMLRPILE
jgi:hypothetical protein